MNDYWRTNFRCYLPDLVDFGNITASTADTVTVDGWIGKPPPPGTKYEIQRDTGKIYDFDYGEYTGLAFHNGLFYAVWADNSNSTTNNPELANATLDVYTAAVTVTHNPGAGNVHKPRGAPDRQLRRIIARK